MAKEIAARKEAEVDEGKKLEQDALREEYEKSGDIRRMESPILTGDGNKIHYPDNAAG